MKKMVVWLALLLMAVLLTPALAKAPVKVDVYASQIYVPVGSNVKVYVKVQAVGGEVSGQLMVKIRKDIIVLPDQDYVSFTKYINLAPNQVETVYMGTFVAKDKTTDDPWAVGSVREYFPEVYFNGQRIDPFAGINPSNPSDRPFVKTY